MALSETSVLWGGGTLVGYPICLIGVWGLNLLQLAVYIKSYVFEQLQTETSSSRRMDLL